jgi:regulator of cell morphogenesis and NO signaling
MSGVISSQTGFAARTLADIAATLRGVTDVLRRRKSEASRGGHVPLAQAAAGRGIAVDELEAELETAAAQGLPVERPEWNTALIDLIVTRYHARYRRELPGPVRHACRVEANHKDHKAVPRGIAVLLERMIRQLEFHMKEEELFLFPMMRRGGHPLIAQPIAIMLAEHDKHAEHLHEREALTNTPTAPDDASPTWRVLYVGGKKLVDDLREHVRIDNNVLFPRFLEAP